MATTKSGEKATKVRGYDRVWLLQFPAGHTLRFIEVKPGIRIEDIDTRIVERHPNVTWEEHVTATRITKADGAEYTGWIVARGRNDSGPIATKADALRNMRYLLADITTWFWKD